MVPTVGYARSRKRLLQSPYPHRPRCINRGANGTEQKESPVRSEASRMNEQLMVAENKSLP
jgi:hypothetical protein